MREIAISIQGLSKSYGWVQALDRLDLSVECGEIFGFLGPNGAGKTTTIRCLLGLIRPQEGEIRVLGLDPRRDPVGVRLRCGYLPGELNVDDNLTVREALRFFIRLRGGQASWTAAQDLAERLDLDLTRHIKNLSKGNKQKVGVVQALMHNPEVLLLDEPTSGLDPLVQQTVLEMVSEARQAGVTVFFSSHILSEVQAIAGRVGIIRQGTLVEVANTADLLQRSLRRLRLRFARPVDPAALLATPGVSLLAQPAPDSLHLEVAGEMDALVKALAAYPVQDLETERPSLEEVFLAYYREQGAAAGK
ncbi:MAG: ATP-binding cassette domain-containing protein [Omnitrophica WOR_2 bacterium]